MEHFKYTRDFVAKQGIDPSIAGNYFVTNRINRLHFQKSFNPQAIFGTLKDKKLIANILACLKVSFSGNPNRLDICFKAGFHDDLKKTGFSLRHIIARNHAEPFQSVFPEITQGLAVVKASSIFFKELELENFALALDNEKKALVGVIHNRDKFQSLRYVLVTLYFDEVTQDNIRLIIGTMYTVKARKFELIRKGNEYYTPLVQPQVEVITYVPSLQIETQPKAEVPKEIVTTYEKIIPTLAPSGEMLEPEEGNIFDENVSFLALNINGYLDTASIWGPINWETYQLELNSLLDDDLQQLDQVSQSNDAITKKLKQLYVKIIEANKTLSELIKNKSIFEPTDIGEVYNSCFLQSLAEYNKINLELAEIRHKNMDFLNELINKINKFDSFPEMKRLTQQFANKEVITENLRPLVILAGKILQLANKKTEMGQKNPHTQLTEMITKSLNWLRLVFLNITNKFIAHAEKNEINMLDMKAHCHMILALMTRQDISNLKMICQQTGNEKQYNFFEEGIVKICSKYPYAQNLWEEMNQHSTEDPQVVSAESTAAISARKSSK